MLICIVLFNVDDIVIVSDSLHRVTAAKAHIRKKFSMTDFGLATSILGMDIARNLLVGTAPLSREQYTTELLEKYGMLERIPSTLPMSPTHYSDLDSGSPYDHGPLSPVDH
jgi:hypothetical protein